MTYDVVCEILKEQISTLYVLCILCTPCLGFKKFILYLDTKWGKSPTVPCKHFCVQGYHRIEKETSVSNIAQQYKMGKQP